MGIMFFASTESLSAASQYQSLLNCVRRADQIGIDAVWIPERHYGKFGGLFPAPAVLAAAIATNTSRIGIRAGSVVTPLHEPLSTVEDWSIVDNLSAGRVQMSLASGWNSADFCLSPDQYVVRKEVTLRHVNELRRLWRGEALETFLPTGEPAQISLHPRPVQPEIPLWMTSSGSRDTFMQAGQLGTGILTHMLGQSLDELAANIREYRRANVGAPDLPSGGKVAVMLHTMLGIDNSGVIANAKNYLRTYFSDALDLDLNTREIDMDVSLRTRLVENRVDHHLTNTSLIGTPERCADHVSRLLRMGVDQIACLVDFGPSESEIMETIDRIPLLLDLALAD